MAQGLLLLAVVSAENVCFLGHAPHQDTGYSLADPESRYAGAGHYYTEIIRRQHSSSGDVLVAGGATPHRWPTGAGYCELKQQCFDWAGERQ